MGVWLAIAKPIVVIWAGLNAIDDLSLLFRFARLGSVLVPGLSSLQPHMMCDVCDDVMGDLLKGSDGLQALPYGEFADFTLRYTPSDESDGGCPTAWRGGQLTAGSCGSQLASSRLSREAAKTPYIKILSR